MLPSLDEVDEQVDGGLPSRKVQKSFTSDKRQVSIDRNYMLNMDHDDEYVPMRQMLLHASRMLNMLQWNVDHDNQCNKGDNQWMSVETTRQHPIWAARGEREKETFSMVVFDWNSSVSSQSK